MQLGADYRAFGADVEALTGSRLRAKLVSGQTRVTDGCYRHAKSGNNKLAQTV